MKEYKNENFYMITINWGKEEHPLGFFNEFEIGFEAFKNLKKEDFPDSSIVNVTICQIPFGFNLIKNSILEIATPIVTRKLEI